MDRPRATQPPPAPPAPAEVQASSPEVQVPPGMSDGTRPWAGASGLEPATGTYQSDPASGVYEPGAPMVTVASYNRYADAQRAVDRLSDQGFPVQYVTIVGTGLRLEEQVLGRLTAGRAASAGAGAGAWLGLLLGLFAVEAWLSVVVLAAVLGAVWGAILGAAAHAMTRGQRDFTSRSRLQASEYAVNVSQPFADDAWRRLDQSGWGPANPTPAAGCAR
jgi:hypothetical protein